MCTISLRSRSRNEIFISNFKGFVLLLPTQTLFYFMTKNYLEFLEQKKHSIGNFGFKANYIPDIAFDFQKFIIEKSIVKGRIGIFADTGLGKTLIQLSIAKNIIQHTNKKVLILTPLAVAFQFILEAEKLGIDDVEY